MVKKKDNKKKRLLALGFLSAPIILKWKQIAVITSIILILTAIPVTPEAIQKGHWQLLDNDTVTPNNESWNVSIGKNETTAYKFYVNGTSFFNDTVSLSDVLSIYPTLDLGNDVSIDADENMYLRVGDQGVNLMINQTQVEVGYAPMLTGYDGYSNRGVIINKALRVQSFLSSTDAYMYLNNVATDSLAGFALHPNFSPIAMEIYTESADIIIQPDATAYYKTEINFDRGKCNTTIHGDNKDNLIFVNAITDNVGINKTNPSTLFDVNGGVTATAFFGDGGNITNVSGGNPFNQDLNTTNNVEFRDVVIDDGAEEGSVHFGGSKYYKLQAEADAFTMHSTYPTASQYETTGFETIYLTGNNLISLLSYDRLVLSVDDDRRITMDVSDDVTEIRGGVEFFNNITADENITCGHNITAHNITANGFFKGNGSLLTGISAFTYSDWFNQNLNTTDNVTHTFIDASGGLNVTGLTDLNDDVGGVNAFTPTNVLLVDRHITCSNYAGLQNGLKILFRDDSLIKMNNYPFILDGQNISNYGGYVKTDTTVSGNTYGWYVDHTNVHDTADVWGSFFKATGKSNTYGFQGYGSTASTDKNDKAVGVYGYSSAIPSGSALSMAFYGYPLCIGNWSKMFGIYTGGSNVFKGGNTYFTKTVTPIDIVDGTFSPDHFNHTNSDAGSVYINNTLEVDGAVYCDGLFVLKTIITGDDLTPYEIKGSVLLNETTNLMGTYATSWYWR